MPRQRAGRDPMSALSRQEDSVSNSLRTNQDLLGPVALPYNSTVHTSTGFMPHELFYSFLPSCALDAMIDVPTEEPDQYTLQVTERMTLHSTNIQESRLNV